MFVEGMKGIGAESEPWTDLRFSGGKVLWQKEGGQLDRSQRNLDLGTLTYLKIGIQHPSIIVQPGNILISPSGIFFFSTLLGFTN